jgi:hypothetical protein
VFRQRVSASPEDLGWFREAPPPLGSVVGGSFYRRRLRYHLYLAPLSRSPFLLRSDSVFQFVLICFQICDFCLCVSRSLLHRCCFVTVGGDGRVVFREFRVVVVNEDVVRFLGLCSGDWWR